MVKGLPKLKEAAKVCKVCNVGKQQRGKFPKKSGRRASEKLELIHGDLCGPITPTSHSGKRDVIFEEGGKWDWNLSATELKQNALAWGDDEAVTEEFEAEYTDSDVEENEYDKKKELPEAGQSSPEEQTRRERRQPSWMNNYESGEGLSEEEELEQNLAFYISHDDPVSFDEAVKEEK
ncbi:hypothetical protein KIW84_021403 [Lathyrus oleraceus]|uniref:Uncharacterized protein n=1 Tax=Pisum sativum TaxID=3888 RepID=A0A9D4YC87_PEA|nr:hypothetical protein KIW84_021403 [Pisum sativum]